jgi:hypothetical protein
MWSLKNVVQPLERNIRATLIYSHLNALRRSSCISTVALARLHASFEVTFLM